MSVFFSLFFLLTHTHQQEELNNETESNEQSGRKVAPNSKLRDFIGRDTVQNRVGGVCEWESEYQCMIGLPLSY